MISICSIQHAFDGDAEHFAKAICKRKSKSLIQATPARLHNKKEQYERRQAHISKLNLITSNLTKHKHLKANPQHQLNILSCTSCLIQNQHLRRLFLKRRHVFLAMGCAYRCASDRDSHRVPMVALSANQQGAPCNMGREKRWLQWVPGEAQGNLESQKSMHHGHSTAKDSEQQKVKIGWFLWTVGSCRIQRSNFKAFDLVNKDVSWCFMKFSRVTWRNLFIVTSLGHSPESRQMVPSFPWKHWCDCP